MIVADVKSVRGRCEDRARSCRMRGDHVDVPVQTLSDDLPGCASVAGADDPSDVYIRINRTVDIECERTELGGRSVRRVPRPALGHAVERSEKPKAAGRNEGESRVLRADQKIPYAVLRTLYNSTLEVASFVHFPPT